MRRLIIFNNKRTFINPWHEVYDNVKDSLYFPIVYFDEIAIDCRTFNSLYMKKYTPIKPGIIYYMSYSPREIKVKEAYPKKSNILLSFKRQSEVYKKGIQDAQDI